MAFSIALVICCTDLRPDWSMLLLIIIYPSIERKACIRRAPCIRLLPHYGIRIRLGLYPDLASSEVFPRSNSLTHSWMSPDKLNGLATQAVIFHYMREMSKNRPSRTSSACCISLHGSCHVSLNSINHIQWKSKLMFQRFIRPLFTPSFLLQEERPEPLVFEWSSTGNKKRIQNSTRF